ncbi:MAG: hypothetical protein KUG74_13735 [Rhodobacteraceae bacterium]|nr:hypothetical protein [Paracoccaceae bacterium]
MKREDAQQRRIRPFLWSILSPITANGLWTGFPLYNRAIPPFLKTTFEAPVKMTMLKRRNS